MDSLFSDVARNFQWGQFGKARGMGAKPPALGNFCNFSIKITQLYAYFGQNRFFKTITYQLKAFENHGLNVLNK